MAKYIIRINPKYIEELSTGSLRMQVPRKCKYSIIDKENGDRVMANIEDSLPDPFKFAELICRKLNS